MVTTFEKFQFTENPLPGGRMSTFIHKGLVFMVYEVNDGDPFYPDDRDYRPSRPGFTRVKIESTRGLLGEGFKTDQELNKEMFHTVDQLVLKNHIFGSHIKKRNDNQLLSQE